MELGTGTFVQPEQARGLGTAAGFKIRKKGVLGSGSLFGNFLTERIPFLETISEELEKRQNIFGFVSFVIAVKP